MFKIYEFINNNENIDKLDILTFIFEDISQNNQPPPTIIDPNDPNIKKRFNKNYLGTSLGAMAGGIAGKVVIGGAMAAINPAAIGGTMANIGTTMAGSMLGASIAKKALMKKDPTAGMTTYDKLKYLNTTNQDLNKNKKWYNKDLMAGVKDKMDKKFGNNPTNFLNSGNIQSIAPALGLSAASMYAMHKTGQLGIYGSGTHNQWSNKYSDWLSSKMHGLVGDVNATGSHTIDNHQIYKPELKYSTAGNDHINKGFTDTNVFDKVLGHGSGVSDFKPIEKTINYQDAVKDHLQDGSIVSGIKNLTKDSEIGTFIKDRIISNPWMAVPVAAGLAYKGIRNNMKDIKRQEEIDRKAQEIDNKNINVDLTKNTNRKIN